MNFPKIIGLFTCLGLSTCLKIQLDQVFGAWVFEGFFQSKAQSAHFSPITLHCFRTKNVKTFGFAFLIVAQIWQELHSDNLIQLLFIILGILNADVM